MQVYLIRHGLSKDDENGLSQRSDSGLSETGKKHVLSFKEFFDQIPFNQIYYSPWERAKETAFLLFSNILDKTTELPYIHEYRRPQHITGVAKSEVIKYWGENRENLLDPDWKPEDGESFNETLARAKKFKNTLLKHSHRDIVGVVSHGIFLRHLIGDWLLKESYTPHIFAYLFRNINLNNVGYILLNISENGEVNINKWHNWETST